MRKLSNFTVISLLFVGSAQAMILPSNDLNKFDNVRMLANLTEAEFNQIINEVVDVYEPLAQIHGAHLLVERNWTDSMVNAYAYQNEDGTEWSIAMYGGLARRPEVTPDAFSMVVCHELGHHFGGYVFYSRTDWAASEGQSDYFATNVCAQKIWENQTERNREFRATVPRFVKEKCDQAWSNEDRQNLCYRTAAASAALADLLASLGRDEPPHFDTPDPTLVSRTIVSHPDAQCRLDTYFQASLCRSHWEDSIIPAKGFPGGQDTLDAEREASAYTCSQAGGDVLGNRPRCWFLPKIRDTASP